MTASKSLPPRPSVESLRKQAKKLARDSGITLRNAQLAIAREYGYAGWKDLLAEVSERLAEGVEWAVKEARRIIHDNDVDRLKQLLIQYPSLLSWPDLLGIATASYGDSFDPEREQHFTRPACAELLIDAGAIVLPSVYDGLLRSRARGLLQLLRRKDLLPRTLKFLAAVGDFDGVRAALDEAPNDLAPVTEAFITACSFEHEEIALLLLERVTALDSALEAVQPRDFTKYFIENRPARATDVGLWKAFVMEQVMRAVYSWSGSETSFKARRGESNLPEFVRLLKREQWLLGERFVDFQTEVIERATLTGGGEFISALFDLNPAILHRQPPPASQAIEFAFTYANTHLIPLLSRIWSVPDDLPHAAGMGDLARVKQWFDDSGALIEQGVLDVALAWSVINGHLDVADFLLQRGADINTTWSSHEPASILHELVWHRNYDAMQFLIDRGIDMTITDYRWNSTAQGWAEFAAEDPELARWLRDAERQQRRTVDSRE